MVGPAPGALASTPAATSSHELFGCDATSGIVAVEADANGRARVWRRVDGQLELFEHTFPNWFLTTSLDLLAHLPARRQTADWLRRAHGKLVLDEPLTVVELDDPVGAHEDAYRFLVLTSNLEEVETALLETASKRDGEEAVSLADLRGLVLIWPPIEQFLTLTGRTFFKRMPFSLLHRLQFDLETTGLNEDRDRIFMISMRDSSGWRECLDTASLSEAALLERFVATVRERDPDTFENHNIFGFDLSFLVKRAARLGVRLALGRDGTEPRLETDVFDVGERAEPFLRWHVAGRQVIDTQHAVKRFGIAAPDMRRHGLKEAARYFGLARADREYVPGAEIWATYRTDPERVRRYAEDDVDEVDGLSRRLLPPIFELASMLPRPYERIAADTGAASLWELLLVRAYLHEGRAIAAPMPKQQRASVSARSELFVSGVMGRSVRAVVRPLLPRVMASQSITAANDDLRVLPRILNQLLGQSRGSAGDMLSAAAHAYVGTPGLFADAQAASEASVFAGHYIDRVLSDVRSVGASVIEVDGDCITFEVPEGWDGAAEDSAAARAAAYLPAGVELEVQKRYVAVYARAPGISISLDEAGAITLIGPAFRAGRLERFGEAFMHRAAPFVLSGDLIGLRRVFVETVDWLRMGQIPLEDLCVQATLHKSPQQHRRGGTHEEPYEVLLAAGIRSWRVGQRIRYFRARGGEPRLLQQTDGLSPAEADTEYYIQRLCQLYCQQFAQAFRREDFSRIFRLPAGNEPDLSDIRTIKTQLV